MSVLANWNDEGRERWQWCRWNGVMGAFAWLRRRASERGEGEMWDFNLCTCKISICETATVDYWAKRTRRKGQHPVDQIIGLCLDTYPTQIHFCSLHSKNPQCLQPKCDVYKPDSSYDIMVDMRKGNIFHHPFPHWQLLSVVVCESLLVLCWCLCCYYSNQCRYTGYWLRRLNKFAKWQWKKSIIRIGFENQTEYVSSVNEGFLKASFYHHLLTFMSFHTCMVVLLQ